MFDTKVYKSGPEHVSIESTVHEHRAPTDESVKLLRELEEQARERVEASITTPSDNAVQGTIIRHLDPFGQDEYRVRFSIDGEKFALTVPREHPTFRKWEMQQALAKLSVRSSRARDSTVTRRS